MGLEFSSSKVNARRYIDGAVKEDQIAENSIGFHNVSITYAVTADNTGNYISTSAIIFDDITDFQTYTSETVPDIPQYAGFSFAISAWNHVYISNVLVGQVFYSGNGTGSIPSDNGIPADTPIYRLSLGTPITDFTAGDKGEYIGTANVLQAVNASSLITTHGNRPINHIFAYGDLGYRVGSAVSSATGIYKSDNNINSHGTHTLSFDKTAHIYDVWKIGDGNTLSDINGLQVSWRAGK
ncbi:MAG: hypothetical protein IJK81_02920 [Selenomonadaceae bacterium]|nr:hypothetical protein [Selenomonadaceae bacterium]